MIERKFVKDGYYQVYNRGNHRKEAFHKEEDYGTFLRLVEKSAEKYKVQIFVYCLLPNHFHLVIQQSEKHSMSRFMHSLGTAYAMYFNNKYDTVGHVFQGPYRATHIETEESLFNEINYVLRNPEKHEIVNDSSLYKWVGRWS
jgi:REP element-mobilizing transposase RayT